MGGKRGEQPSLVVVGDDDLVVGADALFVDQAADEFDALASNCTLAQDNAGVAIFAQTHSLIDGVCCFGIFVIGGAQRGGAGNALLVDAGLGISVVATFPLRGVVANEGVAVGRFIRGVLENRLNRTVLKARLVGRFDAKVLDIARAKVLGAAIIRIAVGRKVLAHVHLRAGERRGRHGHDGCSSKGEAYA